MVKKKIDSSLNGSIYEGLTDIDHEIIWQIIVGG